MKIAMLVLNNLEYDSRVKKEAASLIRAGHELLVFSARKIEKAPLSPIPIRFDGVDIPVQPMTIPFGALEKVWQRGRLSPEIPASFPPTNGSSLPKDQQSLKGANFSFFSLNKTVDRVLRSAVRSLLKTFSIVFPPSWVLSGWRRAVVAWSPDVVHCHDLETCALGLEVGEEIDCVVVYDSHELWTERTRKESFFFGYFVKRAERALESKVFSVCGGAITVSPEIADHLSSRYPIGRKEFTVVRNAPKVNPETARAGEGSLVDLGTRLGSDSVIYSGRISPKRALDDLLNAVALGGNQLHVGLLGYGEERYRRHLFDLAHILGVDLTILDPVESGRVPAVLAQAKIVFVGVERVSMSYEYSLPNKYFEAMASGRPVVYPLLTSMARDALRFPSFVGYQPGDLTGLSDALSAARNVKMSPSEAQQRRAAADWGNEEKRLLALYGGISPTSPRRLTH